jgi:hypothetical protein
VLDRLGYDNIVEKRENDRVGHAANTGADVQRCQAVGRAGRRRRSQRGRKGVQLRKDGEEEQARRELLDVGNGL